MKKLALLLALAVVLSQGYTPCTGGLLAIPQAIASEIGHDTDLMSHESLSDYGCFAMSILPAGSTVEIPQASAGCDKGDTCFDTVEAYEPEHALTQIGSNDEVTAIAFDELSHQPNDSLIDGARLRIGPLFADATAHSHTLAKRE